MSPDVCLATRPAQLPPGVALTLWHDDGLLPALAGARPLLEAARPPIVQLHAGPRELVAHAADVAAAVRAAVPNVRLWVGAGCDGWLRGLHAGTVGRPEVIRRLLEAADTAQAIGAEAVVWDPESEWKVRPDESGEIASELLSLCNQRHPALTQGFTSFDGPVSIATHGGRWGGHSSFPWRAWLGPDSPVALHLPQQYAAPEKGTASIGGAKARRTLSGASIEAAVAKGWIRADLAPGGSNGGAYVQGHHVPTEGTLAIAEGRRWVAVWAAPTRIDADGEAAVRKLCGR